MHPVSQYIVQFEQYNSFKIVMRLKTFNLFYGVFHAISLFQLTVTFAAVFKRSRISKWQQYWLYYPSLSNKIQNKNSVHDLIKIRNDKYNLRPMSQLDIFIYLWHWRIDFTGNKETFSWKQSLLRVFVTWQISSFQWAGNKLDWFIWNVKSFRYKL